jgi:hypothetical protein
MTGPELTPEQALVSLLTSEISLLDVPNPAELAETIITWLRDSGFAIVPADSIRRNDE